MSAVREIACHVGCRGEAGRRRKADDAEGRDDVFVGLNGVVFHQAYHHQHPWILKRKVEMKIQTFVRAYLFTPHGVLRDTQRSVQDENV